MTERPDLPATGEAHVWRIELGEANSGRLTTEESARASRIRAEPARTRWIAARAALRTILADYLDTKPDDVPLRLGPHGKPELALDPAPLHFNLSHSSDLAVIALSAGREVGIDVERIVPDRRFAELAQIGLDEESAEAVSAAGPGDRARVFYAAWTRREAIVKCLGVGLGGPLPRKPEVTVVSLDPGPGYAAALALAGERPAGPVFYAPGSPPGSRFARARRTAR